MSAEVTVEMLQAFADAWNRHDPEALMSFMSDDCVFEASAGPEVAGTRYVGREAVKAGYLEVFATFTGPTLAISYTAIVESPSGPSQERARMAVVWK